jgi:hypothetical protein
MRRQSWLETAQELAKVAWKEEPQKAIAELQNRKDKNVRNPETVHQEASI